VTLQRFIEIYLKNENKPSEKPRIMSSTEAQKATEVAWKSRIQRDTNKGAFIALPVIQRGIFHPIPTHVIVTKI
jgi:hypothetical protein